MHFQRLEVLGALVAITSRDWQGFRAALGQNLEARSLRLRCRTAQRVDRCFTRSLKLEYPSYGAFERLRVFFIKTLPDRELI
ncbi:hypothetical protein [Phormidium sp. CCY1219]|uniref:hypothetical protein n=1 Tax=Phormidium sp. CCY1219 TaxID=2886104 RepID=UPI002D1E67D5|nr:hypothetical protein [Phormidium sp. CCY1219]MEB3826394.1 hypothetical protein [Phormidium sp. CCY1219]